MPCKSHHKNGYRYASENYDYTIIDYEAGLEHLSRRITRDVDIMLLVLHTTLKSLQTALRLKKIATEIDVDVKKIICIANKIPEGEEEMIKEKASKYDIKIEEIIPYDSLIEEYDLKGMPVVNLPDDAPSVVGVRRIAERIIKGWKE